MPIFASNISSGILNEINRRDKAIEGPDQSTTNLEYISRLPFIILESNAVRGGDNSLAKNNVLYGGSSRFLELINSKGKELLPETTLGKRPLSGITSINVKNRGTLGSLREAQINFQCWSLEELETFTRLYMNPGIYLYLQWGYYNAGHIPGVSSIFGKTSIKQLRKPNTIRNKVLSSNGCYDALAGPCSNFSWKMNQSAGFDCSVTIITPASFVFSFSMNNTEIKDNLFTLWMTNAIDSLEDTESSLKEAEESDTDTAKQKASVATLKNKIESLKVLKKSLEGVFGENATSIKAVCDKVANDNTGATNKERFFGSGTEYHKYIRVHTSAGFEESRYISLGHLCTLINTVFFAPTNTTEIINAIKNSITSTGNNITEDAFINAGTVYFDLSHPTIVCRSHKDLRSFDPQQVLIINTEAEWANEKTKKLTTFLENGRDNAMKGFTKTNAFFNIGRVPPDNSGLRTMGGDYRYGRQKAIYINLETVARTLKSHPEVANFIDEILKIINASVDGIFNLTRYVDEDYPLGIRIVDTLSEGKSLVVPLFSVYKPNTTITNISMDGSIPSSFQAAAYVGNTSQNASSRDNSQANSFAKASDGYRDADAPVKTEVATNKDLSDEKDIEKQNTDYKLVIALPLHDISTSSYMKTYCIKLKNQAINNTEIEFLGIPVGISLNLSIDGISGLQYGNLFNLDYIPQFLTKNVAFQIKDLDHTVDASGWITKIAGLLRPMNVGSYKSISNPIEKQASITMSTANSDNGRIPNDELATAIDSVGQTVTMRVDYIQNFKDLIAAAKKDGIEIKINDPDNNSYRKLETQAEYKILYEEKAAIPGKSNHGSGRAIDIIIPENSRKSKIYIWLAENGPKYGFYNKLDGKNGKINEPWHWSDTGK